MRRTTRRLWYTLLPALPACALVWCASCARSSASRTTHEQEVAQGRQLYDDNGCAACHGPDGHGDGLLTKSVGIAPIDFRNPQAFVNGYGEDQIASAIADGAVQGSQSMPAFTHLSVDERKLLAVFILSLNDNSKAGDSKPGSSNQEK